MQRPDCSRIQYFILWPLEKDIVEDKFKGYCSIKKSSLDRAPTWCVGHICVHPNPSIGVNDHSMTLGISEAATGLGTWEIHLFSCSGELWPISRTDRWRKCQKHDSHDDGSRVCRKLAVSEGVHVPATASGRTDRNAASNPACEHWLVMLFSLSSYLGLQWKDFVCLFKSFLGSFPILAWTPDIWLLEFILQGASD